MGVNAMQAESNIKKKYIETLQLRTLQPDSN